MKPFRDFNENGLVPGIEEVVQDDKTPTLDPEDPLPVHVIPYEGESARANENIKSSEPKYLNKATGKGTSSSDCVQQVLKN